MCYIYVGDDDVNCEDTKSEESASLDADQPGTASGDADSAKRDEATAMAMIDHNRSRNQLAVLDDC
jgi:hypothetical protein